VTGTGTGTVCLQGGGEFSPGYRPVDADLLARADGPVVITALAGAVGREYATAGANGLRHFRALGADDVVVAPDVREDPAGALAALRRARLLVLPGGSPGRLLGLLQETEVGQVVRDLLAAGGVVSGSSAGAMVLGSATVLPDRGLAVVPALGVVPGTLVLPHWSGARGRGDWLRAVESGAPAGTRVLGIAEDSGVVLDATGARAVGRSPVELVGTGTTVPPGSPLPPAAA
jgi:cyanophycinase